MTEFREGDRVEVVKPWHNPNDSSETNRLITAGLARVFGSQRPIGTVVAWNRDTNKIRVRFDNNTGQSVFKSMDSIVGPAELFEREVVVVTQDEIDAAIRSITGNS